MIGVAKKNYLYYENVKIDYDSVAINGSAVKFDDSRELVGVLEGRGYSVSNKRGIKSADDRVQFIIKGPRL
jgi:hypothetical protein